MKTIKGDLLEGNWDYACHVANSYCVMGSGVAYFLRKKWPQVYEADLDFQNSDDEYIINPDAKLGKFSLALIGDDRAVFNLYAMWGVGNDGHPLNRNCSYDSLFESLYKMAETITTSAVSNHIYDGNYNVGVPKLMGCVRAGGAWTIVEAILQEIENLFPRIEFTIYELEDAELKATSSVTI